MQDWPQYLREQIDKAGLQQPDPEATGQKEEICEGRLLTNKRIKDIIGEYVAEALTDAILNNSTLNPFSIQVYYRYDIDLPVILNEPAEDEDDVFDNKLEAAWVAVSLRYGEMKNEPWHLEVYCKMTKSGLDIEPDIFRLKRALKNMTEDITETLRHTPECKKGYEYADPVVRAIALRLQDPQGIKTGSTFDEGGALHTLFSPKASRLTQSIGWALIFMPVFAILAMIDACARAN